MLSWFEYSGSVDGVLLLDDNPTLGGDFKLTDAQLESHRTYHCH